MMALTQIRSVEKERSGWVQDVLEIGANVDECEVEIY